MQRRQFISLLGATAAWPIAARAQQPAGGIKRLGVLMAFGADDPELKAYLTGFRQGLEKRGWQEGRNLLVDYRLGVAVDQMAARAKELISLQPDVVFTQGTVATAALQHESSTVPIVFVQVTDPIDAGFIASAARRGPAAILQALCRSRPGSPVNGLRYSRKLNRASRARRF
jgi:putative tryptophan/tyrosine transport system substrate-binding protein